MPKLRFFFEFASTYSYLSVMRAETLAAAANVELEWIPFLLGPVFKSQGWDTSPFNIYPAKGQYMVRDIQRIAESRALPFMMPAVFPVNGLLAARVATVGIEEGWVTQFTKAAFQAQFAQGLDLADHDVIAAVLMNLHLDPQLVLTSASSQLVKDQLRTATQTGQALGVFGAPSFVTECGELFWGDDRLEQALAWASRI